MYNCKKKFFVHWHQNNIDIQQRREYTDSHKMKMNIIYGNGGGIMGTVVTGGVLLTVTGLIIRKMIRDKKSGRSCCGGDCGHCKGCH